MANHYPNREIIRQRLEETRQAFHQLLSSVDESLLHSKSGNPAWDKLTVLAHITDNVAFYERCVRNARKGRNTLPPLPRWLLNRLNAFDTRMKARRATPTNLAKKYDSNHAKLLQLLDEIREDEWGKRTRSPLSTGGFLTIEAAFNGPNSHFAEHSRQLTTN